MAGAGKTILVVEDDQETLYMLSRCLAAGGFNVLWARDGADALQVMTRHRRPVDLLLVDVVLPGMSGPEVAAQATERFPNLQILYVSAYDAETVRSHGVDPDRAAFLPKPYDPLHLVELVAAILDARQR